MRNCFYNDGEGYCERTGRTCPYSVYDEEECPHYADDEDSYSDPDDFYEDV